MKLHFVLSLIVMVFIAAPAYAVWEFPTTQQEEAVEPDTGAIREGAMNVYEYCQALPASSQPAVGCSCVVKGYEDYNQDGHKRISDLLNHHKKNIQNLESKMLKRAEQDGMLVYSLSDFCERYFNYKNLEYIPDRFSRDLVKYGPQFDDKEHELEYQQELIELRQKSRSMSVGYCNSVQNIKIMENLIQTDLLSQKSMGDAYKLSQSACQKQTNVRGQ